MNPDEEDREITELLTAIGQVDAPSAAALDDACEALWSAIADEMLFTGDAIGAGAQAAERDAEQPRQPVRQRRPDKLRQSQQRRRPNPGE
jgi:hypothetical protein